MKEYHKNNGITCRPDEIKEKISNSLKEYHKNKIKIYKNKINQYDINNVLVNTFNTIIDASKATNICRSTIGKVCCNKLTTAGGFIWKRK